MNKINNNKIPLAIIFILILLAILYFVLDYNNADTNISSKTNNINKNTQSEIVTNNNIPIEQKYNLDRVAEHKTRDDCWTIIDNKVYNITNFIPKHEGGDVIVNMCGIDGTDMFNNQHRGQSKPARILMKLVMGLYEK